MRMSVDDQKLITLPVRGDARGSLVAIESSRDFGFPIRRVYYIFGTDSVAERGFHAHRALNQLAICVRGRCVISLDDGRDRRDVVLDRPDKGITIGSMIWREMRDFSEDAVLLVLADQHYDETDYIRDYNDFIAEVSAA